ncbi:putative membrane protein [Burkholderia cenocepacia]|nr:putative membrane protein [Burkholderia cenocepacia]
MRNTQRNSLPFIHILRKALPFAGALTVVAVVYGAVPFVALPTLGQALWVSSFAQSFANSGWPSIFAHNFGLPAPAPIAFGLSGALVESAVLAATPLNAADAYSATMLLFLALALWGAKRYALAQGASARYALPLGVVWATLPVVWAHAGYSMLSAGIALLPLYLWTTHRLCDALASQDWRTIARSGMAFAIAACLAVFTDGYTFVMFAVGATVQYAGWIAQSDSRRVRQLAAGLPIYAVGFGIAFALYRRYIDTQSFHTDPLSVFRGYGVDVTMLVRPTQGLLWIWDTLRISTPRSDAAYFGDASVWFTTFVAPVAIAGMAVFALTRARARGVSLLVLGAFATYLALGPSLKIDSVRPDADRAAGNFQATMPAEYAIGPTGSAYLSTHVPGFKNMRASYRWIALTAFAFWALFVLLIGELSRRDKHGIAWSLLGLMLVSNLPHPASGLAYSESHDYVRQMRLHEPLRFRDQFEMLDRSIVADFREDAPKQGITAFIPQGNDFLAAYLAATSGTHTYNIGGDKNVAFAQAHWPPSVATLFSSDTTTLAGNIDRVLTDRSARAVVISYVNLLWNAHIWPPSPAELDRARAHYATAVDAFSANPRFVVKTRPYYALIMLRE